MAMNGSPTTTESPISSDSPLPSIPSLSPHTSSSSDSFDSSRPNSQASSATSRSASPSPNPKSVSAIDSHGSIELPVLPSNPPLQENTSANQSHHQNDTPRSIPPSLAASPKTNHKISWLSRLKSLIPRRNWFANALGAISLGLTLIGMIIFGERTYKLAVWSARNDALDTCGQLNSTGITLGPNCKKLLSNNTADVILPPYSHWKRAWNATLQAGQNLLKDGFTKRSKLPTGAFGEDAVNSGFFKFSSVAIVLASTVITGGLSLIVFRRYWRTEEVFTSPVRSDWQFTRHHQEGPETVTGEGYRMIRCNPEDHHPLGQLRQGIRSSQPNAVENLTGEPTWQSHNTSEDTLLGPWKDTKWGTSKVSLTTDTSDETHDNLIELETNGPNKTFFDPETGEFIHLTPWKSTGYEDVHGLKPDGKGSTKRALIQMTLGGAGWAGGKNIDDQLAEELQANSKAVESEKSKQHQAGDCVTGDMAHEAPSGKPTMDSIGAVREDDIDEVDLKVTEFLLRKPWYAGIKHDTNEEAEAESQDNLSIRSWSASSDIVPTSEAEDSSEYYMGTGIDKEQTEAAPGNNQAWRSRVSEVPVPLLESDLGKEDAGFWIPQTYPDGRPFYFNTATRESKMELPPGTLRWSGSHADREDVRFPSANLRAFLSRGPVEATREALEDSLHSLRLIRRATKLASNLDRGETASRTGVLDILNAMDKESREREGTMSDKLAAFPSQSPRTPPASAPGLFKISKESPFAKLRKKKRNENFVRSGIVQETTESSGKMQNYPSVSTTKSPSPRRNSQDLARSAETMASLSPRRDPVNTDKPLPPPPRKTPKRQERASQSVAKSNSTRISSNIKAGSSSRFSSTIQPHTLSSKVSGTSSDSGTSFSDTSDEMVWSDRDTTWEAHGRREPSLSSSSSTDDEVMTSSEVTKKHKRELPLSSLSSDLEITIPPERSKSRIPSGLGKQNTNGNFF